MDKVKGIKFSFLGNRRWSTIIFLVLVISAIAILTWNFPFLGDDYTFHFIIENGVDSDRRINNIYDIFVSQYNHLLTANGRVFVHFVLQFILAFLGKWFFNLLNPLVFLAYILLTAYYAVGKVSFPAVVVTTALVLFMPTFADIYLWMAGSMNYLWASVVVLIFLNMLDHHEGHPIGWSSWKLLLLSFVAGCSHEGISVPIAVGFLTVMLLGCRKIRHTERFWMLVTFAIGAFICAVFTIHRAAPKYDELQMIIYDRIEKGYTIFSQLHLVYLLITLVIIGLFVNRAIVLSVLRKNVSWLIVIFMTVFVIYVAGVWFIRAAYMIEYASLLLILRLLYELIGCLRFRRATLFASNSTLIYIVTIVLGIMIIVFFSCVLYWSEYERRQFRLIEDQIFAGNQVICYDIYETPKIFQPYLVDGFLQGVHTPNPNFQPCRAMAKYYHVKSLAFFPRQLWDDMADKNKSFDEFTDCGYLPFYAMRDKDTKEIEKIWYVLRPATDDEKPWWVRLTGIQREDDGEVSYEAIFDVVFVDDERWIFVQKYDDLDSRLDYLEITYKEDGF